MPLVYDKTIFKHRNHSNYQPEKVDTVKQFHSNDKGFSEYSLIVLSIATFRSYYKTEFPRIAMANMISDIHYEYLYDWVVREALNKALQVVNGSNIQEHYRHDVYKCIYDQLGPNLEIYLQKQIHMQNFAFLRKQNIKTLVAGDTLILARGVSPNY